MQEKKQLGTNSSLIHYPIRYSMTQRILEMKLDQKVFGRGITLGKVYLGKDMLESCVSVRQ